MDQSVVINPGGDPSEDFHPSSQTLLSSEAGDSGVVSKKSNTACVCHFCGRLCRNAQALGGHMNVHRRERALAKQLMELRNEGHNLKGTSAASTAGVAGVAAAAAASGNSPAGEWEQDHHLEVITNGGSSSSSSSPPSPHSIAIASALVHPWRSLHRLPSKNRKRREAVDLELRLGFTPRRFL